MTAGLCRAEEITSTVGIAAAVVLLRSASGTIQICGIMTEKPKLFVNQYIEHTLGSLNTSQDFKPQHNLDLGRTPCNNLAPLLDKTVPDNRNPYSEAKMLPFRLQTLAFTCTSRPQKRE